MVQGRQQYIDAETTVTQRIKKPSSVFDAELSAIQMAVNHITNNVAVDFITRLTYFRSTSATAKDAQRYIDSGMRRQHT